MFVPVAPPPATHLALLRRCGRYSHSHQCVLSLIANVFETCVCAFLTSGFSPPLFPHHLFATFFGCPPIVCGEGFTRIFDAVCHRCGTSGVTIGLASLSHGPRCDRHWCHRHHHRRGGAPGDRVGGGSAPAGGAAATGGGPAAHRGEPAPAAAAERRRAIRGPVGGADVLHMPGDHPRTHLRQ